MNELLNKSEILSALQSGVLGLTIGAIFALVGFKPPSPDNLAGIGGIIGMQKGNLSLGLKNIEKMRLCDSFLNYRIIV